MISSYLALSRRLRSYFGALVTAGCALGMAALPVPAEAALRELDRIVAVVDEDVVLGSELVRRVTEVKKQMEVNDIQPPPDEVLISQVLERLILESAQVQEAARRGIQVDDETLTQAVMSYARQNRLSLDQFQQALAQDGVTYADFRLRVQREMLIERVQRSRVNRRVQISEADVQTILDSPFYEALLSDQFRLAHIILEIDEEASEETVQRARQKANELVATLRDGADFANLAVTNSAASNALDGGDLGWRRAGELPSLYAERALEMQPDEVADPIKSGRGYHIIKLLERRGSSMERAQQTNVRHILMRPTEIRTDRETRDAMRDLHQQLLDGADFAELAKEHSEDPGSGLKGGDLGWSQAEDFVPQFAAIMDATAIGAISKPFKSQFGWHVLQVMERREQDMSEEAAKQKALQILHQQRYQDELQAWLKELRDEAFVDVRLPGAE